MGYDDEHSKMKCFEERNKILPSASKLESKWKMREGVSRIVAVNSWVKVNESLGFPKQNTARIAIAVQCYSVLLQCYTHRPGRPLSINLMSRYICFSQNGRFDVRFEELVSKA